MKLKVDMLWEKNLSVNHMRFGTGGHYRKKPEVQTWMEVLGYLLRWPRLEWPQPSPSGTHDLRVKVDFRFPDGRRRDDHNFYKAICDGVAAGLGVDDSDIRISTGTVEVDKANPGFTITIEDAR